MLALGLTAQRCHRLIFLVDPVEQLLLHTPKLLPRLLAIKGNPKKQKTEALPPPKLPAHPRTPKPHTTYYTPLRPPSTHELITTRGRVTEQSWTEGRYVGPPHFETRINETRKIETRKILHGQRVRTHMPLNPKLKP